MKPKTQRASLATGTRATSAEVETTTHILTKQQLAKRLATTPRQIELMVYKRRIPVIRLGHRTVRFSWPKVEAALAKLETAEV